MDKVKVLLVDDEESFLEATKIYLEKSKRQNLEITPISSVREALMILCKEHFDVIISDYKMPDMDGLEFLAELRESKNDTPFIMFTGKGREEVVIQALNLGADYYLQKGGDPRSQFRELINLIEKSIEKEWGEGVLRGSEEKYRDLVENINDIIYAVDENGVVTYISPVVESFIGYSPEEIIGRHFAEFIYREDLQLTRENFQRIRAGLSEEHEYRVLTKSGEIHWMRSSSRRIFAGDRIVGVQGVLVDSTEWKRNTSQRTARYGTSW